MTWRGLGAFLTTADPGATPNAEQRILAHGRVHRQLVRCPAGDWAAVLLRQVGILTYAIMPPHVDGGGYPPRMHNHAVVRGRLASNAYRPGKARRACAACACWGMV